MTETEQKILFIEHGECIAVTHQFARRFLLCCANECRLSGVDNLLLELSIMRLLEPASKLRTIRLLSNYFGISYSQRIYRKIPKLIEVKKSLEFDYPPSQTVALRRIHGCATEISFQSFRRSHQYITTCLARGFPSWTKEEVKLNEPLIEKNKLLLGIKGYCTNLPESNLSNEDVIARYHNLWRVEQSFRMSKSDLETRPIFHHKEDAIRAHVLICFVALIIEKYLELSTGLSFTKIRDLIWNITETHIRDILTQKVFVFSSPVDNIMNSPLAKFVKLWKLLPH